MANNRFYLRCRECLGETGAAIHLGSKLGDGYGLRDAAGAGDAIQRFLDDHETCCMGNETCLEIAYEHGDPEVGHPETDKPRNHIKDFAADCKARGIKPGFMKKK